MATPFRADPRIREADEKSAVPTLFRFVLILALLAGLVYAGMWALALLVEPEMREITTTVPPSRLAPR